MSKISRQALSTNREIYKIASRCRLRFGFPLSLPLDPFELADHLGLEVRYLNIPGMDGLYLHDQAAIIISSLRPNTRQTFTCAHEIAHYILGHGSRLDQIMDHRALPKFSYEERQANALASALLITDRVVARLMNRFKLCGDNSSIIHHLYIAACYLGVSLAALYHHLRNFYARQLPPLPPVETIRRQITGISIAGPLLVIEKWWDVPITLSLGDCVLLPSTTTNVPASLSRVETQKNIYRAVKRGITEVNLTENAHSTITIRVMPSQYVGLAQYRFLEE